jgi:hypothetical protein
MKINLKSVTKIIVLSITVLGAFGCVSKEDDLPKVLPLANAGFEDNLASWAILPAFKGQIEAIESPVHSGNKAIKIDATKKLNSPFVAQSIGGLTGGAVYQFSAWARVVPGSPAVTAALEMEAYGTAGSTGELYGTKKLDADGTWTKITLQQRVSGDTNHANLLLRVFGDGVVIFDDATFEEVGHAPDLTIISPAQVTTAPEKSFKSTYELILREPWNKAELPKMTATLSSLDEGDNSPELTNIPAVVARGDKEDQLKATITIPKLKAGSYGVQFQTQGDEPLQTVYPAYIFTTLVDRKPKALTQDGTLLWNGKPFFPIGMYHPGGEDSYKLLAENGFNAVQGDAVHDLVQFKARLDLAQKYGLAVDVPLYLNGQVKKNLANSLEKVNRFADHPAILDWKIFDEPHIHPDGGVAIDIPSAYRALKAADPNHPIELTLNSAATQQFWSNFCDIVQPDVYPLPRFSITQVSDMAKGAHKFMQPWQNLSMVLQCGWVADLSNQPSVAQARSMVYLALINGAKGIWWYSMHDPGWDLTKSPLWQHMKEINAEVKVLSEPLMLGEDVPVEVSNSNVQASAKKYQRKLYVLVTNPMDVTSDVTLNISGLTKLSDGTFMGNKVKVQHSADNPNVISLKLEALQSGTLIFDLP